MLAIKNEKDKLTAILSGELDHHTAFQIRAQLDTAIERAFPQKLVLDFENVGFMDSSGVGLIMGRYKLISSMGGEIIIENASPEIAKIIRMSGLDSIVSVKERVK